MVVSTHPRSNLYGLERGALAAALGELGAARYHAHQAYRWMYARSRTDPSDWTDHKKELRRVIGERFRVDAGGVERERAAADGTCKYLVRTAEGATVECVWIVTDDGRVTLCISSQEGCALDCDFCLTAKMGFRRHLNAGEIVGQVAGMLADRAPDVGPYNVVFMGMGEPLHNFEAVMAAVRILTDPDGFGISRRRITVSTVGLVRGIERLARESVRPRLAVSLNATTDEVRDRIMPVNRTWNLERLLSACRTYSDTTGDRFTFEYVLLREVNDTDDDLVRLARIVRAQHAKLNLIPFNEVEDRLPYRAPSTERVEHCRDELLRLGVAVSVRWSRGREARAACGQLAVAPDGVES